MRGSEGAKVLARSRWNVLSTFAWIPDKDANVIKRTCGWFVCDRTHRGQYLAQHMILVLTVSFPRVLVAAAAATDAHSTSFARPEILRGSQSQMSVDPDDVRN